MKTVKTLKGTELPLMDLRGRDYLQVAYRLVWFREDHAEWSIETSFLDVTDTCALARAIVRDEKGRIISTGHKFEDKQGFGDFREKAETGAIGRALALCGYGTQFTDDLDEGERIVDSPTPPKSSAPPASGSAAKPKNPSQAQLKRMWAMASQYRIPEEALKDYCMREFKVASSKELTLAQYDQLCTAMERGTLIQGPGAA